MHDDFPSPAIWFTHRISYGETDTMGVLYYAEYLHIFERARSEFIRACGMSYRDVEEKDIILPVREAQCRYRSPARYDDLVQVHTAISQWGRASMRFVYEMWNEDKTRLLATGSTQHALVNHQGRPDRHLRKKPGIPRLFLWLRKNFSQYFLLFSALHRPYLAAGTERACAGHGFSGSRGGPRPLPCTGSHLFWLSGRRCQVEQNSSGTSLFGHVGLWFYYYRVKGRTLPS